MVKHEGNSADFCLSYTMKHATENKIGKLCWVLNLFMPKKWNLYFLLYLLEMETVMYEMNLEARG